jgi:NAD(P)H-dependent FMN reductase
MSKIAIIIGSTRTGRVGAKVEAWLNPILKGAAPDVAFTTVDVATFKLPVFDESVIPAMVPAMAQWTKPHSAAWSDEIAKYDGYVLVANEYNFGVSGSTKNAIDYLYHAWIGKPILIITYGIFGGKLTPCAISRAVLMSCNLRPLLCRADFFFSQKRAELVHTRTCAKCVYLS